MHKPTSSWRRFGCAVLAVASLTGAARATAEQRDLRGADESAATLATATFAGGCFWCMEGPFDDLEGVLSTTPGYTGGHTANPGYEAVSAGGTGHAEAVQIVYDPGRVTYGKLLDVFWHNIDPTTPDRQFCDHGDQYRPAIFYHDEAQREAALASLAALERSKPFAGDIKVQMVATAAFYPAEEYHQDYYLKNPIRYKFYRYSCGRDQRLHELWGGSAGTGE